MYKTQMINLIIRKHPEYSIHISRLYDTKNDKLKKILDNDLPVRFNIRKTPIQKLYDEIRKEEKGI